jgi:RNA polymerase sigma-70 factor, ECF subfamily
MLSGAAACECREHLVGLWPGLAARPQLVRMSAANGGLSAARPRARPEDLHAIRRCLGGDPDSFRHLVERYQQRVAGIMWRFSMDAEEHDELVGQVFIEAFEGLGGYRAQAPFEHWLARIATRVGYRHWKRRRRDRSFETVSLEECEQLADAGADEVDVSEAAAILYRLLAQLPPRDRLVLTLRHVEDCSVAETAQRTGWSQSLVKVQAFRARKKLERLYQLDQGGDVG